MARYKTKRVPDTPARKSRVGLWLALAGLALLALAAWAWMGNQARAKAAVEVSGAPSLKVDREVIDYGDVPLGKQVRTEVRVTNVGDQTLELAGAPYVEVIEGC
jgi:hypothetical protein